MTTNALRMSPFRPGAPVQHQGPLTADEMASVNACASGEATVTRACLWRPGVASSRVSQRRERSQPVDNLFPTHEIWLISSLIRSQRVRQAFSDARRFGGRPRPAAIPIGPPSARNQSGG